MREFWLEPAHECQLNMSPDHIYSAVPCVGVFRSEQDFIHYLTNYDAPKYGGCVYRGIKGVKERENPLRICPMNYKVEVSSEVKMILMAEDLPCKTIAIVVARGIYLGHLIIKTDKGLVYDITDGRTWEDGGKDLAVRMLTDGDNITIRGQ